VIRRRGWGTATEPKNKAAIVPEVALVLIAFREPVAETRQHIVKLNGPDGKPMFHWNIEASTNDKVEGIVARIGDCGATQSTSFKQVLVGAGVRSTE